MARKWIEWIFLFTAILTLGIIILFLFSEENKVEENKTDEIEVSTQTPSYNTLIVTTENKTEKQAETQSNNALLEEAEQALFEIKLQKQEHLSVQESEELENEINRWISELQQYEDHDAQNLLQQFLALQDDRQENNSENIEQQNANEAEESEQEETEQQESETGEEDFKQYSEEEIIEIIEQIADKYNIPSWFLKAIVRRESSFNNTDISYDDGIEGDENWNNQRECAFTEDGYPHGLGLTKLTGWMYQGSPYPFCLETPENNNEEYYYAMRMQDYGNWIEMEEVTLLTDPFNPEQNLERFLTGYAIPAHELFTSQNTDETEEELWRRVAFHWNKGLYTEYDPENTDYLALYDTYVELYQNE